MQRKYQQFPVWTEHLVKTTRLLNHTQIIARTTTDIVTLVLTVQKINNYYLSFVADLLLKNVNQTFIDCSSYHIFICCGTHPNTN